MPEGVHVGLWRVVSFLRTQRIDACAYTGETEPGRRLELEDGLRA